MAISEDAAAEVSILICVMVFLDVWVNRVIVVQSRPRIGLDTSWLNLFFTPKEHVAGRMMLWANLQIPFQCCAGFWGK
jgi:hypothetical protein